MNAFSRHDLHRLRKAIPLGLVLSFLLLLPTTGSLAEKEEETYAETPAELLPFRGAGEPYSRFFQDPPVFRGPGAEKPPPKNLKHVALGVLMPYEGLDRNLGLRFRKGVELAVREANENGGVRGLPVEPLFRDESRAWGAAANAAVELTTEHGVWGLVGAFDDTNTHVLSRALLKLEVPVVNTSGTDPTLTEHAIPWMIRVRPDDRQNAYRLAERIFETDEKSRVAVFRANDRYARTGIRELVDAARRLHHPISLEVRFDNHTADDPASLTAQIERIRGMGPDAVVLWGRAEPSAHVLRALRGAGIDVPVYGPDRFADPAFLKIAGAAAEGLILTRPFDPKESGSTWDDFRRRYRAAWDEEPDAASAYAYDGTRLLLEAIEDAGLNRVRIRERLVEAGSRRGVTGPIRLDATFNNVVPVRLGIVRSGRVESLPR